MNKKYNNDLARILEYTEDAIISKSLDGTILSWNKGSERMVGYTAKEMIGKNISLLIPPESINDDKNHLSRISHTEIVDRYETTRITKNGEQLVVALIVFGHKDKAGAMIGSYEVARDITSQKKYEVELIETNKILAAQNEEKEALIAELLIANKELAFQNEEKQIRTEELLIANNEYKYLFDNNPSPLFIFDFETLKIIACNIESLMLYGYSREEFLQLTIKDICPEEDIALILETTENESAYGEIHKKVWRHLKKNGELMYVEVTGHLLNYNNRRCSLMLNNDITDRKKAEEKLSKAKDALQKAFNDTNKIMDSSLDLICVVDKEGCFVKVSASCEAILGYKPEELIGKPLTNYVYKIDNEKTQITADIVMSGKSIKHFENRYIRKDGSLVHMEWTASWDETDKLRYGVARDITERKIAEEKIIESENRMRLVTSSAAMGIWYWDNKNDKMVWDKKLYQIYDINESQLGSVYEGWLSRLHPEDKDRVNKVMQTAIADKKREYSSEFRIIWDDLSVHYIKGTGITEYDDNGNVIQMMGVNWDITAEKEKEQHLKLLESVIINTTDSILITEAEPFDAPGPRILYVNEAFTKMTGYTAEEVIGKTPRILQGPKSDKAALKRLGEAMRRWETCEITTINYKKNGEEFWINFTLTPVANEKGWYTHWIAIERDVTIRKNEELQNELIADISAVFNEPLKLHETLDKTLRCIAEFGDFCFAEAWVASSDQNVLKKISNHAAKEKMSLFIEETKSIDTFIYGEGLTGVVAKSKEITIWGDLANQKLLRRREAALKYGLKTVIGLPLLYNNEVIGVLAFGLDRELIETAKYLSLFKKLADYLSHEIKRKQLELESNQMFNFAPDLIVIIGLDGYFKKVNPAACQLLGYTQEEISEIPYIDFIHPEDKEKSTLEVATVLETKRSNYFENRYITKSGKTKWLAWNAIYVSEYNTIYAVAKDITDKKELEHLLQKVNELARIGGWEVDLQNNTNFWSDITKEIHEVTPDYIPNVQSDIAFYKKGSDRTRIVEYIEQAINTGKSWDDEFQIITAKGNNKWVRSIGEAEFVNGNCIRIYGSFQDITEGKLAAEKIKESEARLAASQSVAKIGSWETDLINFDVIWSDETCRIFGVANSLPHTTHESFLKFVHPDDKEKVDKAFVASFTSNSVNSVEHRIIAADGVIKEIEERWHIAIDKNGKPRRALGTVQDITDRKKAELKLIENENYLRTILYNEPECVKVLNRKGELVSMNPAGLAMIEADNEQQVLGQRMTDLVNKEYLLGFKQLSNEVFKGNPGNFEFEITGLKGRHRWLETNAVPLKDASGKIVNLLGVTRDITDRKKVEQQFKLFASVVTNTKDSVLITEAEPFDAPGPRILYVNEAFTKMTGYTAEEVIGKTPRILQGPKSDRTELKRLSEAMRRWETCEITTINYKKNGEEFWINFTLTPVANEKGWYTHWIAIERDVTVQKEYISTLESQNIKLREIAWSQSHIVRAPLTRMMGIVGMLTDFKMDSSEYEEWVKHFNDSAKELDNIIKDIVSNAETNTLK